MEKGFFAVVFARVDCGSIPGEGEKGEKQNWIRNEGEAERRKSAGPHFRRMEDNKITRD